MGISTLEIDYHVVEHRSLIETLPMTATHNSAPIPPARCSFAHTILCRRTESLAFRLFACDVSRK